MASFFWGIFPFLYFPFLFFLTTILFVFVQPIDIPPSPEYVVIGEAVRLPTGVIAVDIDWQDVSGFSVDYYQVEISNDAGNTWKIIDPSGSLCCGLVVYNLTLGDSLYARVKAHNRAAFGNYTTSVAKTVNGKCSNKQIQCTQLTVSSPMQLSLVVCSSLPSQTSL